MRLDGFSGAQLRTIARCCASPRNDGQILRRSPSLSFDVQLHIEDGPSRQNGEAICAEGESGIHSYQQSCGLMDSGLALTRAPE